MNLPTYKSQFDKITEAYIKGEIKPMSSTFCFCGTLSPDNRWNTSSKEVALGNYPYSFVEYKRMEDALFNKGNPCIGKMPTPLHENKDYEDALFNGMCAALDVLKQIHIEKGEIIEEGIPVFKKRELCVN